MALARATRRIRSRGFATQVSVLKNGLKVATTKREGGATACELLLGAGSRHDVVSGSAAVLPQVLSAANEEALCKLGATATTDVGRETTAFSVTVAGDAAGAIDTLGTVSKPKLTEAAVTAAKTAHLQALDDEAGFMGKRGGVSESVLVDRLHVSCFRDSTLGNPLNGTADTVADITMKTLQEFHAASYAGSNSVLAVTGPVEHSQVVALAEKNFGAMPSKPTPIVASKPYFLGSELVYRNDEMGPHAFMALGYEGVPLLSSDSVCFDLFAQIIGEYNKSDMTMPSGVPAQITGNRVANEIANKMQVGCAEHYRAFNLQYSDTGLFGWFGVMDELAVEHMVGEMIFGVNMLSSSVTPEEVERAKRELKLKMLTACDSSTTNSKEVAAHIQSYGRVMTPEEYALRLDAISTEDVKRVAWKYLHDAELAYAALGPLHGLPDHYHVRRNTAMWRY